MGTIYYFVLDPNGKSMNLYGKKMTCASIM